MMEYKAYDLPHHLPVATNLTSEEASRFDDEGFFVIPQLARLADYGDEMRNHQGEELSEHGEAMRQIQKARAQGRSVGSRKEPVAASKVTLVPDYKAITRKALRGHTGDAV